MNSSRTLAVVVILLGLAVSALGYSVSREFDALEAQEIAREDLSAIGESYYRVTLIVHPFLRGASPRDVATGATRLHQITLGMGVLLTLVGALLIFRGTRDRSQAEATGS